MEGSGTDAKKNFEAWTQEEGPRGTSAPPKMDGLFYSQWGGGDDYTRHFNEGFMPFQIQDTAEDEIAPVAAKPEQPPSEGSESPDFKVGYTMRQYGDEQLKPKAPAKAKYQSRRDRLPTIDSANEGLSASPKRSPKGKNPKKRKSSTFEALHEMVEGLCLSDDEER